MRLLTSPEVEDQRIFHYERHFQRTVEVADRLHITHHCFELSIMTIRSVAWALKGLVSNITEEIQTSLYRPPRHHQWLMPSMNCMAHLLVMVPVRRLTKDALRLFGLIGRKIGIRRLLNTVMIARYHL